MTQIIGPKSCLHNLINLQFPHNRRHRAVPRSYCVAPLPTHTHSAMQTHHCSPQQDALLFSPFPPKSPLSLPDACCLDTNVLLLLSSLSKHRQEGKSLTVCLVPYATWQQSPTDMVRVWATAKGSLKKNLFYFVLSCMCLNLGWKCGIKKHHCMAITRLDFFGQIGSGTDFFFFFFSTIPVIPLQEPLPCSCESCLAEETPQEEK